MSEMLKSSEGDDVTPTVESIDNQLLLEPVSAKRLAMLVGPYDENLKLIELRMKVSINYRGNEFSVRGVKQSVEMASALLNQLYKDTEFRERLEAEFVHMSMQESGMSELVGPDESKLPGSGEDSAGQVTVRTYKRNIKPRGKNQRKYVRTILEFDVSFGIGPAGTGKTYLAVACAVNALMNAEVSRILLVRPAVEAGEKLGFLPGDLAQKIDPYLRPLYDALYEMMGVERVNKLIERNVIEVAPLAYMRGRTLNDSFIILDESQNTTIAQMKMFLTRIGENSKIVVNGDPTQIDLPNKKMSGLVRSKELLGHLKEISIVDFDHSDVVRHPLVSKIVKAYSKND